MSNPPLVTIVIPTYNRPDFLGKTLESILAQTYRNLEVIVVSNGISAANEAMVRSFGDLRVIYADQENSGGPSSPRNHGIRLAKGKYIAFCDDDDLWMPHKVEKQVVAMEAQPDYGFCYTKMTRFDATGYEWTESLDSGATDLNKLLYINTIPISSVMVRADLIRQYGGFHEGQSVGASEDYEFALRYAAHTKLLYIDEYLIKYWCGNNRTTIVAAERCIRDDIAYLRGVFSCYFIQVRDQRLPLHKLLRPIIYQLHWFCRSAGYMLLKRAGLYGRA